MATTAHPVLLKDYTPPAFLITELHLDIDLYEQATTVVSRFSFTRNPAAPPNRPLILFGNVPALIGIALNGVELGTDAYHLGNEIMTIAQPGDAGEMVITTRINPEENTSLEGLYLSNGNYFTQCEPEGFRKITYYPDRPDVLTRFRVRLSGDKEKAPVLLANGNLVESGDLDAGRHFAVWEDPFPKPCYLFALVAGQLEKITDTFTTASGRKVLLEIYVEARNIAKCEHAMRSLKKSMQWDEERFGLEYDLDRYMIVAVDDFNMGAMENKGLNIFNSKYVLADPETATDADYIAIEEVIGHEYFHNWTGNRVTCRDWFQLSLKEGLTVFRDQEFSADMNSRGVKRIQDVRVLRTGQFPEDSGPMAHPVRPESYLEINNFYTATVYNKGAEVIRMLHTMLGEEKFIKAVRRYLHDHDGTAATIEDFVEAMESEGDIDLSRFMRWYRQAGTPRLNVSDIIDEATGEYLLQIKQVPPVIADQESRWPHHIPLAMGLLDPVTGAELHSTVLQVTDMEQEFRFPAPGVKPLPSLLRGFSAPIQLSYDYRMEELALLFGRDTDPFSRWEAGQELMSRIIFARYREEAIDSAPLLTALEATLVDSGLDDSMKSLAIALPSEKYLAEQLPQVDPARLFIARESLRKEITTTLGGAMLKLYNQLAPTGPYDLEQASLGRRSLRNALLGYLAAGESTQAVALCDQQYREADNMTDRLAALSCLVNLPSAERDAALDDFYRTFADQPLVVDKWFTLQAFSTVADAPEMIRQLMRHPAFTLRNPNRVRSLIGAFSQGNFNGFHAATGEGYQILADLVIDLDKLNPQVAARMVTPLGQWRKIEPNRAAMMKGELERILSQPKISKDVFEIVEKSIGTC